MSGEKRISLKIDVINGTIEIDAPVENFDQAIEQTKQLTDGLDIGRRKTPNVGDFKQPANQADAARVEPLSNLERTSRVRAARSGVSSARPGRIGSFTPERDLLSEEQQVALRQFMAEKAPSDQPEQIQAALYKGEDLLERQGFGFNEIYTLLWRAGVDPLPKALDVAIQRLMQEQRVEKNEHGYFLKFIGRNFVEKELPRPKAGEQ